MTHLIELKDVYKIYPMGDETVHALDGVSLSICLLYTSDAADEL